MSSPPTGNSGQSATAFLALAALIVTVIGVLIPATQIAPADRFLLLTVTAVVVVLCSVILWRKYDLPKWLVSILLIVGGLSLFLGVKPGPPADPQPLKTTLTQKDTEQPSNQLAAGIALFRRGEYREASEKFKLAVRNEADRFEANKYLGLCYLKLRDYEAAKEPMKLAFVIKEQEIKPFLAEVYYNSGIEWLKKGNKAEAVRQHSYLLKYDSALAEKLLNVINRR